MHDLVQVLKNVQRIYENTGQLKILTDFERVFDRLDIYLYENWKKGELVEGPVVERADRWRIKSGLQLAETQSRTDVGLGFLCNRRIRSARRDDAATGNAA